MAPISRSSKGVPRSTKTTAVAPSRGEELPLFSRTQPSEGELGSAPAGVGPVAPERKYLSVSELTAKIRGTLEPAFQQIWVQGEVSNYRPTPSGHAYFSLKDAGSTIPVAIFGWGGKRKAGFDLRDGLQLLCRGKLSVYAPRGGYQLVVDQVEPLGAGALQLAFEQLKAKLHAEGLFDPKRKRPLPSYPLRLAVITSPSGAAIRDMLNILARRAPQVRVLVVPALVQGDEAPRQLIRGLDWVNRHQLGDVVILARGGGSIEDLWCFNDEALVRAISQSRIPVISGVGHEIDFTLSDFAADLRAPTPSAAAEIATGHWVDSQRRVREASERMKMALLRDLSGRRRILEQLSARVVNPRDRLREQMQRCDDLSLRLERAVRQRLERRRAALEQAVGKLEALSPLRVLERGYSIVRSTDVARKVIRAPQDVTAGQRLTVTLREGEIQVQTL